MQPTSTPIAPVSWQVLGAVAQAQETYARRLPAERGQGHGFIFVSLARFKNAEVAADALRVTVDDGMSLVMEYWPIVDVTDVDVSLGQDAADRRLISGTISRGGESLFSAFLDMRVDRTVATVIGYSSYAPITLETAYLGHIIYSLMDSEDNVDLAQLLPAEDILAGRIEIADQ